MLICAFGALIKEPLLSDYEWLNVHPSLLPRWRGAAPIERAIDAGDERTGVSIMRPTAEMDAGPVCLQRDEPITPEDTYGTLALRLAFVGGELLVHALDTHPPFEEQPDDGVTIAEKITADDRRLDPGAKPRGARAPGPRALAAHRRLGRAARRRAHGRVACARVGRPRGSGPAGRPRRQAVVRVRGRRAGAAAGEAARRTGDGRGRMAPRSCREARLMVRMAGTARVRAGRRRPPRACARTACSSGPLAKMPTPTRSSAPRRTAPGSTRATERSRSGSRTARSKTAGRSTTSPRPCRRGPWTRSTLRS